LTYRVIEPPFRISAMWCHALLVIVVVLTAGDTFDAPALALQNPDTLFDESKKIATEPFSAVAGMFPQSEREPVPPLRLTQKSIHQSDVPIVKSAWSAVSMYPLLGFKPSSEADPNFAAMFVDVTMSAPGAVHDREPGPPVCPKASSVKVAPP
jgi:hypothetical protein